MSGFVALVNLGGAPVDIGVLGELTSALAFRGPHARCARVLGSAGLGQTLLELNDTASPTQPFTLDGERWIVADARIDGRDDLVAAIRARGHAAPKTDASDVELVLRAYEAWGADCVEHLIGDFAFALWDASEQRLFCARDQLGVKPLFYSRRGDTVIVSNTLDCIRRHPAASRELNDEAIADFLLFGFHQDRGASSFRDICRLPPAHTIEWSRAETRCRRYWTMPIDEPIELTRADDYADRFTELVRDALRDRLRTRRVGVLMSGGVDSPTLAAVALNVLREQPGEFSLQAVTSVYDRLIPDSERRYAGLVARHLRIPIAYDVRDDETSIAQWDCVSVRTPEPVDNPPAFAAGVAFFEKAASDASVFLYGEGPDNALLYEWRSYLTHLVAGRRVRPLVRAVSRELAFHRRVPFWSSIRNVVRSSNGAPRGEEFPAWLNEDFATSQQCRERWRAGQPRSSSPHPVRPRGYNAMNDARWQPLFDDCDRTGATSRTEIRHPFLDLRVLRYMLAVPAMPWCRNKLLIRRSMRSALPRDVLRRRKAGLDGSPDFERVKACGLPRVDMTAEFLKYVNPAGIPAAPASASELRSVLRPIGLSRWLQNLGAN